MSLDVELYRFVGTKNLSPETPYEFGREIRTLRRRIGGGKPAYQFSEEDDTLYRIEREKLEQMLPFAESIYTTKSDVERIQEDQIIVGVHGPLKVAYGGEPGFDPDINKLLGAFFEIFPEMPRTAFHVVVPNWEESRAKILEYVPRMQEYDASEGRAKASAHSPQYATRRLGEFLKTVEWVIAQPDWKSYFFHMDT